MIKVNLDLPGKEPNARVAFVIENLYTAEECNKLIEIGEKQGFVPRNVDYAWLHNRAIVTNETLANDLFTRLAPFLPPKWGTDELSRCNEQLKFLRYSPGQKFDPHVDGQFTCNKDRSHLTVQLYLNEVDEKSGGATQFIEEEYKHGVERKVLNVQPKTGLALIFEQDLLHQGTEVLEGIKYTIRTDIMYRVI